MKYFSITCQWKYILYGLLTIESVNYHTKARFQPGGKWELVSAFTSTCTWCVKALKQMLRHNRTWPDTFQTSLATEAVGRMWVVENWRNEIDSCYCNSLYLDFCDDHNAGENSSTYVTARWARIAQSVYRIATGWRSGDRIPVGARLSKPVQTGPAAHPSSCRVITGSFFRGCFLSV
jgi:hypothetical protein